MGREMKLYKAKVVQQISGFGNLYTQDFEEAEVGSFEEALEMCKSVGSIGGLIESSVEFNEIDKDNMTAEFIVHGRMRYEGSLFILNLTKI